MVRPGKYIQLFCDLSENILMAVVEFQRKHTQMQRYNKELLGIFWRVYCCILTDNNITT